MALTDNLVSYWKLDETSGTRYDSHGSNNLTDNNTVGYAAGKLNNAADFEASNDESLSITDASQSGLDITGDMSISLWYNPESTFGSDDAEVLAAKWLPAGDQRSWRLTRRDDSGTDYIGLTISSAGWNNYTYKVAQSLSSATWYHIVAVFTAASHKLEVYINGSSVGTDTSGSLTSIYNGTGAFRIGRDDAGDAREADGLIDEFGIWSRVLTASEVSALYNGGSGLAYPFTSGPALPVLLNQYRQRWG